MSRLRSWAIVATVALAGAMIPAAAFGGAAASSHSIVLKGRRFHPGTLTINHGDSVTWLWRDGGEEHNVTFHSSHSRTQGRGSYTLRFNRKGTFNFRCTIHESEGMRGKIIVR